MTNVINAIAIAIIELHLPDVARHQGGWGGAFVRAHFLTILMCFRFVGALQNLLFPLKTQNYVQNTISCKQNIIQ